MFFFFFLIIDLHCLLPAVIAQIFNTISELVTTIKMPIKHAKEKSLSSLNTRKKNV